MRRLLSVPLSVFLALVFLLANVPLTALGAEWIERDTPTNTTLMHVTSTYGGYFYAVGGGGTVAFSNDSGSHWHLLPWVGTDDSLMSVSMITSDDGYAVSSGGEVFYTDNGWETWPSRSWISERQLVGVDAVTPTDAIAYGQAGTILRTTNGVDWSPANIDTGAFLHDSYRDGYDIWVVGSGRTILHSPDNGETWTQTGGGVAPDYRAVDFPNPFYGYIGGTDGLLLAWTAVTDEWVELDPVGLPEDFEIEDISFVTPSHGMALIDDVLYETYDYGMSWEEKSLHAAFGGADDDVNFVGLASDTVRGITAAVGGAYATDGTYAAVTYRTVEEFPDHQLIKSVCEDVADESCRAVYYVDSVGARHAFSNANVFFSWYDSFDDVVEVSASYLAQFSLGAPVTYKPGVKMVKFISVPTVYVVAEGGVLHAIPDEDVAEALYGASWNTQIDDISDAFYSHYTIGEALDGADDYAPDVVDEVEENFGE